MESRVPPPSGVLASLRGLGDMLVGTMQQRFELLSLELHEEKYRLLQSLIWLAAAIFSGAMALVFASVTLVYAFWETARLAVLIGLTAFYSATGLFLALRLKRMWTERPKPFAGTIAELEHDRTCFRTEN